MSEQTVRADRRRYLASLSLSTAWLCLGRSPAIAATSRLVGEGSLGPELDDFIRTRMDAANVPGVAIAIIRDGKLLRTAGFGFANLAQRLPMRADTLINVGSVTKTITCTAVMQLWEQKKLGLDDDVNKHLPFRVRNPVYPQSAITIRQLLTHTSSIANGPSYKASYACGDSRVSLGQWLRDYFTTGGALYDAQKNFHALAPGSEYRYCDVSYGLLGHLVEARSDLSFSDYVLKHVFAPLGMSRSRFLLQGMDLQAHATPYTYVPETGVGSVEFRDPSWTPTTGVQGRLQVPHCLYSFATPPDGLARTSAEEVSRLLLAYMNDGALNQQRLLRRETVALILTDQRVRFAAAQPKDETNPQGLAWYQENDLGSGVVWGHDGGDPGIRSHVAFRLSDRRGVVTLTNSTGGRRIAAEIARRVFAA